MWPHSAALAYVDGLSVRVVAVVSSLRRGKVEATYAKASPKATTANTATRMPRTRSAEEDADHEHRHHGGREKCPILSQQDRPEDGEDEKGCEAGDFPPGLEGEDPGQQSRNDEQEEDELVGVRSEGSADDVRVSGRGVPRQVDQQRQPRAGAGRARRGRGTTSRRSRAAISDKRPRRPRAAPGTRRGTRWRARATYGRN